MYNHQPLSNIKQKPCTDGRVTHVDQLVPASQQIIYRVLADLIRRQNKEPQT